MQPTINVFYRGGGKRIPSLPQKKRPRTSGHFQEVVREKSDLGSGTYGQVFLAQVMQRVRRVVVTRSGQVCFSHGATRPRRTMTAANEWLLSAATTLRREKRASITS